MGERFVHSRVVIMQDGDRPMTLRELQQPIKDRYRDRPTPPGSPSGRRAAPPTAR